MPRKPSRKGLDEQNVRLWTQVVRARARNRCEVCGKTADQSHHIVGRNCRRLKYEPRNGLACCGTCHHWAGTHHGEFAEWMRKHRLKDHKWLQRPENKALVHWTLDDYLDIREDLRTELADLLVPFAESEGMADSEEAA